MDDEKQKELEFTVMPREYRQLPDDKSGKNPAVTGGPGNKFLKLGIIFSFLAVLLGAAGYLTYNKFFKDDDSQKEVPANLIQVPEASPVEKDSDEDGLTDSEEQKHATNPRLNDTDGDGLADGDEINIYKTDPLLSDTDGDGFDDGREVARGYSPTAKSSQKTTPEETQAWTQRIATFQLHEPTLTTLKLKAGTAQTQSKVTYTNSVYKYSLELPAVLTFRESDEGRLVGVYISGTNPDEDILSDPINASLAVKLSTQNLKDWIASQYPAADYDQLKERDINGVPAVTLVGIRDEVCPQNKTFFVRENTIIILTWTCNQNSPFADLYEQIVQSFKFIK